MLKLPDICELPAPVRIATSVHPFILMRESSTGAQREKLTEQNNPSIPSPSIPLPWPPHPPHPTGPPPPA